MPVPPQTAVYAGQRENALHTGHAESIANFQPLYGLSDRDGHGVGGGRQILGWGVGWVTNRGREPEREKRETEGGGGGGGWGCGEDRGN